MLDVYLNASEKILLGISNVRGKGGYSFFVFFLNVGLLLIKSKFSESLQYRLLVFLVFCLAQDEGLRILL